MPPEAALACYDLTVTRHYQRQLEAIPRADRALCLENVAGHLKCPVRS